MPSSHWHIRIILKQCWTSGQKMTSLIKRRIHNISTFNTCFKISWSNQSNNFLPQTKAKKKECNFLKKKIEYNKFITSIMLEWSLGWLPIKVIKLITKYVLIIHKFCYLTHIFCYFKFSVLRDKWHSLYSVGLFIVREKYRPKQK